jgi:hypothetical protein
MFMTYLNATESNYRPNALKQVCMFLNPYPSRKTQSKTAVEQKPQSKGNRWANVRRSQSVALPESGDRLYADAAGVEAGVGQELEERSRSLA